MTRITYKRVPRLQRPKETPQQEFVRELLELSALQGRLDVALARQEAATTPTNRRTWKGRARRVRKQLRLLGVESPRDRSSAPGIGRYVFPRMFA